MSPQSAKRIDRPWFFRATKRPVNVKNEIPLRAFSLSSGFTLLEVLVALSILGMAVTVILQLFSTDLRSISLSETYVKGALEAESKMREILDNPEFPERTWSGTTENGHRFEASVVNALSERTENLQVKMVEITVTVYWKEGGKERSSRLKTLKVVEKKV